MKFESRDWITAFAVGYTTRGTSGPFTKGTGGSDGAVLAFAGAGDGDADGDGTADLHAPATMTIGASDRATLRIEM
jgi:hypothetical protein